MRSSGHRDRIIEQLRQAALPLDDDQLAKRAGITPRQTVNQICRSLEREGVLRRYAGAEGKIVNELTGRRDARAAEAGRPEAVSIAAAAADEAVVNVATGHVMPPGNSREQRDAERVMLDLLGRQVGLELEPATITIPSGVRVEVDGADVGRTVLVECWAHQGAPKSAQRYKVLADAFKLTWISRTIYPRPQLILCLSDSAAAAPFTLGSNSWAAQALRDLRVDVSLVDLPRELRKSLIEAQRRQYR
jgi:hypothetical protein